MKSSYRIAMFVFALGAITTGCASPSYVLNTHARSGIFSSSGEIGAIVNSQEIALLADREPWVMIERTANDGSVWVSYAIAIKNNSERSVYLISRGVRLEGKSGTKVQANYSAEDKVSDSEDIEGGTYFRLSTQFKLPKEFINAYGNSQEPVWLVVPIRDHQDLKLRLWLWKV